MQTHKNTKYKCGECQKLFLTIPDLKRHITTHKKKKKKKKKKRLLEVRAQRH